MEVVRARHMGMCFGVRDAIAFALEEAASRPLTVLGELVHNETVLDQLRARAIRVQSELGDVDTPAVMITAHGASDRGMAAARGLGLSVLDATCPLVRAAQHAVKALARDGFHPVIVGKRDHAEVRGLTEDLAAFDVVLSDDDVHALEPRRRFGIAAQTTQPIARVHHLATLVRLRFPEAEVRLVDTVCKPTRLRQQAAVTLARRCDVVVVIGGAHSNNTRELAATCRSHCARVVHVQTADDLRPEWFRGARSVGLTAGTSTPDAVIDAVEARLRALSESLLAA
jgi:4-hydroxy-3-methylbut-2-en-1-yl diphosphate reductase